MDHMQILKRAWKILWSYRAMWVFGIILALTTASGPNGSSNAGGGGSGGGQSSGNFNIPTPEGLDQLDGIFRNGLPTQALNTVIGAGIALLCLALIIGLVMMVLHYVSKVALIRMVNGYETTGEKLSWRQGFRLGWSPAALRLFLINLLVFMPVFLVFVVLFGCAAAPALISSIGNNEPNALGIIATIGIAFMVIFLAVIVMVALSLVLEVIYRVSVLRGYGVIESIRTGFGMVRSRLKDVFILWLILIGLSIGYAIVLIPVALLVIGVALLLGGGAGAGLFFLIQAAVSETAGWIWAGVVGVSIFLAVLFAPLAFVGGLKETYFSTVWTLAYREIDPQAVIVG